MSRIPPVPEPEPGTSDGQPGGLDRARILAAVAMGTVLVSYAMLVPTAAAAVQSGGRGLSLDTAFAATVPLWLAAHQVPLTIQGQPLTVLPLLPTIAVVLVVAVGSGWAARRLGGRVPTDGGAVLATVAGAHAVVAVLASALLAPELAAGSWTAMLSAGSVTAAAVGIGVLRSCAGQLREALGGRLDRVPGWLGPGLHGAVVGMAGLLTAGSAVLVLGLVLRATDVHAAFERIAPSPAAGVGVTTLAVAYLPNAVVAALSWALGPGLSVGTATASPFGATGAGAPSSFPLLAAMPVGAPPAALGVLVLPVAVGLLVGCTCARVSPVGSTAGFRTCAALLAAGVVAVAVGGLALLAGGRLAAGPYDPVHLPADLLAPAVLLWVGGPAVAGALLSGAVRPEGRTAAQTLEALRTRRVGNAADLGSARRPGRAHTPQRRVAGSGDREPAAAGTRAAATAVVPAQRGPMTVADLVAQRAREAEPAPDSPQPPDDDRPV